MSLLPYLKTVYICSKCRTEYEVWPYDLCCPPDEPEDD